jgi:antiviral helicase SKI2
MCLLTLCWFLLSICFPLAGVGEQKVDTLQDASETVTKLEAERHEVAATSDDPGAQTDLDLMLSAEVQYTQRESGVSGDDKPTQDGKVGTLMLYFVSHFV